MAELQQALVAARLIVDDARLRDDIDQLTQTADATATVIHSVVRAFRLDQPTVAEEERRISWNRFDQASKALQDDTSTILRPTVRDEDYKS